MTCRLKTFVPALLFSAAAVLADAATALGQSAGPSPAGSVSPVLQLDAIAVTATKTERSAFDVPASVTVIGPDELERAQPRDFGDILTNLPGVDMSGGPRAIGEQPNLRGLGGTRNIVSVDGARQNFESGHRGRIFFDPDLLKQVEVLRGPSSALHGSGALGGVIAMTTKDAADFLRPGENLGGIAKFGYQSANADRMGSGTVFGRVGSFDAIGNFLARSSDNARLGNGHDLPESARQVINGFGKIGATMADHHRLQVSALAFDDDGSVPSNPSGTASSSNPIVDRVTRQRNYSARYTFRDPANDWLDVSALLYDNNTDIVENRRLSFGAPRHDTTRFDTSGVDVRNTAVLGRGSAFENAVTFGVDWYKDEQEGKRNGAPRTSFSDAEAMLTGVYLQDQFRFLKDWTLTAAARWDSWETNPSVNTRSEQSKSQLSPKVSLMWQTTPWLSLYASYAEAFRAPTMIELYSTHPGFTTLDASNLRPESMRNYEGGFRLKFDDVIVKNDAVRLKFSYYDSVVKDYIDAEFNTTTFTARNYNLPKASLRGFDLESAYDTGWGFATLGGSMVRGDDETNNRPLLSIPQDKVILGLGGRYRPHNLTFGWRGKLLREQDRIPLVTASGSTLPPTGGSFVQDIYVSWLPQDGYIAGTRVDFGIDNIFDVSYRRHLSSFVEEGINTKLTVSRQF